MEKFIENLQKSEKLIQTADHIIYISFPLIKDKNLLLKTLLQIKTAITNCINSILQYEYLYKRVKLYKDPKSNLKTFQDRCAPKYNITKEELKLISELFLLVENHKKSPMEFVRNKKIIILSESFKPITLTIEKTKEFLSLSKNILKKTKGIILDKI